MLCLKTFPETQKAWGFKRNRELQDDLMCQKATGQVTGAFSQVASCGRQNRRRYCKESRRKRRLLLRGDESGFEADSLKCLWEMQVDSPSRQLDRLKWQSGEV
jgi:hypothetical protein